MRVRVFTDGGARGNPGPAAATFQTGRQIAGGPTIFSAGGKEYVAITVGGSPTSSSGGLASQLQVFSLGGSKAESPKPPGLTSLAPTAPNRPASVAPASRALSVSTRAAAGGARITVPAGAITLGLWNPNSSNLVRVNGKVLVGASAGKGVVRPVSATWPDAKGRFEIVLPASVAGKTLRFWQSDFRAYQTTVATPGGAVDLKAWPTALSPRVARDTAFLRAPG